MTFEVDLPRLALVPTMLDRLAEDARQCSKYAGDAFDFDFGPGLINSASGRHAEVRAAVTGYFDGVARQAAELSASIDKSVRDYENVDLNVAAEWDARLPQIDRLPGSRYDSLRTNLPEVNMREREEPERHLVALPDYRPEWPHEPTWTDLLSPSSICRDAVMGVNWLGVQIGVADRVHDPFDALCLPFVGNWAGLRACSDAVHNLSAACGDLGRNCGWVEVRVNATWRGHAADAAWLRLKELTDSLAHAVPALLHFMKAYREVVDEVAELEKLTEVVVGELIDAAVFAILAVATAETIVGGPLFGAATIVKVVRAVGAIDVVITKVGRLEAMVDAFQGKLDGYGVLQVDLAGAGRLA